MAAGPNEGSRFSTDQLNPLRFRFNRFMLNKK